MHNDTVILVPVFKLEAVLFRSVYESKFVRRRTIVCTLFLINDDGVTSGQEKNGLHQGFMIGSTCVQKVLHDCWVVEVNVLFLSVLRFVSCSIGNGASRELFKFHDIAGKCASLVAENILDLAKLFVEVT